MRTKEYRIIGAYDSETTNIQLDGIPQAFPILHQLGLLDGTSFAEINASNIEDHTHIELYRHSFELYERLDEIVNIDADYVPIILCHNLAFDMYGLSPWLSRHDVRVLAKSARKPITFTILVDNQPRLVIWDTLVFAQQSLERMGNDCGYKKAIGEWDYTLIRTPKTPLSASEIDYAKRDIYTLLCWVCWWIQRNPDIEPARLGANVVTKTGIVREKRHVRFENAKGQGMKRKCGYYWFARCNLEQPKSDDELFTMLASTRGGFTFCASVNASKPYNLTGTDKVIAAYDSTSMHPSQLVSHYYPYRFREMPANVLDLAFNLIGKVTLERILNRWDKPFPVAFDACFEFTNLRPRKGSLFEKYGIFPLASARYKTPEQIAQDEDNGDKAAYQEHMQARFYCDSAENPTCAFGKIVKADKARFYITELTAWEIWQAYEWDSVKAIHGYETGKFTKPNDIDVISVMQFYKAKNAFKKAREEYYKTQTITNDDELLNVGIAPALVQEMKDGTANNNDVEAAYMSQKADLNSIFGISATNQYRRATELDEFGISYVGDFGICNKPKTPKVWYQFGQRIVAWSRIAQICAMYLIEPYIGTIINGDTDSIKIVCDKASLPAIDESLLKIGQAIDKGKEASCKRVKYGYPEFYDELTGIGYYVCELVTDRFCASWNKAYCSQDVKQGKRRFNFTLAGIPTKQRSNENSCFIGVNGFADRLYSIGYSFDEICNIFLGYNVTYANDLIRMNARKFPEWGQCLFERITDYKGNEYLVSEPLALALYPMSKTVNDTSRNENYINMLHAIQNNDDVNTDSVMLCAKGVLKMELDYDL